MKRKDNRRRAPFLLLLTAALAAGAWISEVPAHSGAKGVVKERMDAMKSMAQAMKRIDAMLEGKKAFDASAVAARAEKITGHAGGIASLFPEGSGGGLSEAKPAIWESPKDFESKASDLEAAARKLAAAAKSGDRATVAGAFRDVGKQCGGCHRDYRAKKN